MPFTVSHVAFALPLRRARVLPLAGLAVGAMSPDLEYVLHGRSTRTVSHTLAGIFTLDVPLSIIALVGASVAAPGLAALVPHRFDGIRSRLASWRLPWSRPIELAWLLLAVTIGAAHHVVLDSFTHGHSWGPVHFGVLNTPIAIAGREAPLYWLLQEGLSVVGLVILAVVGLRWLRRVEPALFEWSADAVRISSITAAAGAVIAIATLWHVHTTVRYPGLNKDTAVVVILGAWRATFVVACAVGLASRLVRGLRRAAPTPT